MCSTRVSINTCTYKYSTNFEGERLLVRSDYRWNDDIRMNPVYIAREFVDYIHVTQDKFK